MATVTSYHHLIEALLTRVKAQAGELQSLADALARESEYLARKHQADLVVALREKVMREVEWTRLAEEQASSDFTRRRKSKASAHHVAGIAQAFFFDNGRNAQRSFALARTELARTAPFGTVAIQIAPPGVPDGVTTVCVSRLARQGWTSEQDIRIRLEASGCRLMEPAVFIAVLNRLEQDALEGSVVLPMTCERFGVYMASRALKAERGRLPAPTVLAPVLRPRLLPVGRPTPRTINDSTPPG